ncbi:HAD family phosphatase [Ancylomarina euxinus]|uniref:HAD family phosphatase n=1 Tax=Ancylomarina euxinus TaxID=2283627 RepID=A0A425XZL1_9BACT|nr:HAD family hydrolase [Ancylomarina euxinus]MCZ4695458.1 HAD family hydrolase [Ancylomarina euxinus]MUP15724.1 HAD hydrolase family protein [Ancylomarina euxinus]RRG20714.1 HAD family phosphatase [Ancylomarina euxinus]
MDKKIKIVISDLDGTLLPAQGEVSDRDIKSLYKLKEEEIVRVIATGRNLYSALSVLPDDFPIDYLIFASGAGIFDWQKRELIFSQHLDSDIVFELSSELIKLETDFMILDPIPNNHQFAYYRSGKSNPDFDRRLSLYKPFASPIGHAEDTRREACQLLVILSSCVNGFNELKAKFENVKIIRATSPLDHESIWMEIFPLHISKAYGAEWLCQYLNVDTDLSIVIGNDYNDLDLLEWGKYPFVVSNAPKELKDTYENTKSVDDSGFSVAIKKILN